MPKCRDRVHAEVVDRQLGQSRRRRRRDRVASVCSTAHSPPLPAKDESVGDVASIDSGRNLVVIRRDAVVCSVDGIFHTLELIQRFGSCVHICFGAL